jgi:hypothetical protein
MQEIPLQTIAQWIGLVAGLGGILKMAFEINKIYTYLLSSDRVLKQSIDDVKERLRKLDDDLTASEQESRDARARLWDKVISIERIIFKSFHSKPNSSSSE